MLRLLIILVLCAVIAVAGSQGSVTVEAVGALPLFALCALVAIVAQWIAFVPAYIRQTEVFYDLVGSLTYLSVIALALNLAASLDARAMLLGACVMIWALRLGSFLFARILQDGSDSRFDKIKPNCLAFFTTWNMQGMWVLITAGAALAAICSTERVAMTALDLVGVALWIGGFAIEVIADRQKRVFREANGSGGFITTGLWARSRHPNYFGEITLWVGVALVALPVLQGWQYLTLLSPVVTWALLTRISGIPLLEHKADKRWGKDPEYQAYKANTPVLVPRLW